MNKTVLVTGGSGAIGGAIVRAFTRKGFEAAFTYRTNEASAAALSRETGASAYRADLTKSGDVRQCIAEIVERMGRIDVLVNNAGSTQVLPFALIEEEDWDEMMAANLKTMFLVTREAAKGMLARRSGVIINVGSLAGHRLLEVPVHYAAAKAGVSGFTLALAKEFSRYNIRVNSVVPGLIDAGIGNLVPEKEIAEYEKYCSVGRRGTPEEVAEVVLFLAGDRAGYLNAQSIFVDGGI